MGWAVLAGVLLLFSVLLAARVHVCAAFEQEFSLTLRYLFFRFRLGEGKPGKANKKPPSAKKPGRETLRLFFDHFGVFMAELRKAAASLLRHLRVDALTLRLTVCGEDAAKAAVAYGEACAVVFPAAAFLRTLRHRNNQQVVVRPDFTGRESHVTFRCDVSVRAGVLLELALVRGVSLLFHLFFNPGDGKPAPRHRKGRAVT